MRKEEKLKAKGKGKIYPSACRVPKDRKRDKKAFLSDQCKEIEETIEWESLETSSRKLEISKEYFMQRWAQ